MTPADGLRSAPLAGGPSGRRSFVHSFIRLFAPFKKHTVCPVRVLTHAPLPAPGSAVKRCDHPPRVQVN